jgi:hypothetical protein
VRTPHPPARTARRRTRYRDKARFKPREFFGRLFRLDVSNAASSVTVSSPQISPSTAEPNSIHARCSRGSADPSDAADWAGFLRDIRE